MTDSQCPRGASSCCGADSQNLGTLWHLKIGVFYIKIRIPTFENLETLSNEDPT